nr:HTH domain-containing protein [Janthinobacterium lividum]
MALLGIIRTWHLRDQVSSREIAKRLGISRDTVRRYLRSDTTEPAYFERQSASAIDPYAFHFAGWLKTEAAKSRKQQRSLKQLHEDLTVLGSRGLTTEWRCSPSNGGRVKQSGSIRRAKEHSCYKKRESAKIHRLFCIYFLAFAGSYQGATPAGWLDVFSFHNDSTEIENVRSKISMWR